MDCPGAGEHRERVEEQPEPLHRHQQAQPRAHQSADPAQAGRQPGQQDWR